MTIGNDAVVEVNARDIKLALKLRRERFRTGSPNGIDLSTIAFGAHPIPGYSPNSNDAGGTLLLTNGAQRVKSALLGQLYSVEFRYGER